MLVVAISVSFNGRQRKCFSGTVGLVLLLLLISTSFNGRERIAVPGVILVRLLLKVTISTSSDGPETIDTKRTSTKTRVKTLA